MPQGSPTLFQRPPRRTRGQRERVRTYRPAPWADVPQAPKKHRLEIGVVALLATLAIHAVVLLVVPKVWVAAEKNKPKEKKPDEVQWVKLPPQENFVETDPNVKKEEKDPDTPSFSSQAQLAAQENPVENAHGERAHSEGEKEAHKIVPGSVQRMPQQAQPEPQQQEQQAQEQTPPTPPEEKPQDQPQQEDQAKKLPVTADGTAPIQEEPTPTPKQSTQKTQPEPPQQKPVQAVRPSRPRPRPRPQVSTAPSAVMGPIRAYDGNAGRAGLAAVDARFSQYGEYLQRMLEAISSQWTQLAEQAGPSQLHSGFVDLAFDIDNKGQVVGIQVRGTSLGSMEVMICQDAIQSRAPFGLWSEDMVKTLGERQTIRIKFHYM